MRIIPQELEDIVGADNVTADEETCRIYSEDAANLPILASQIIDNQFDVIAQPITVESLQQLMKYAKENALPIVPRGNGTSGWGGAIPVKRGICVSLTQMNKLVHLDDYATTVTVESGITWRELLMILERMGTTLPVYPSSATAATVGGFVASGGLGIGSAKHGEIGEQVVGLEAVLANGMIARVGDMVLGPHPDDLQEEAAEGTKWLAEKVGEKIRLNEVFSGTYGTFGIITRVTLRTIPKLQLRPFACSFDNMKDLAKVSQLMVERALPYHLRYLDSNHTSKLATLIGFPQEWNRYVLAGALHGTIFENDDGMELLEQFVSENNGSVLSEKRADFYWAERLYPLRFKRQGPSLIPAEVLTPVDNLPDLHQDTLDRLGNSKFAVEGTVGANGVASYLVWILDDERKKIKYTIGWHKSFDIAALAQKHEGRPYAVALWNTRHAKEFYGEEKISKLKELKKGIDPTNMLNPLKVFGGRAHAAWHSQLFGFSVGFVLAFLMLFFGPGVLGLSWLSDLLLSYPLLFIQVQLIWFLSLLGGAVGLLVIKLMTLNQALAMGIPLLRVLDKLLNR
ncbi:MAG: FAD-binding oxidoreductase [Candidatus Thorarchaeota archaeon]|jgi:FAD/FMN-containing dehydrogenase